MSALLLDTNVVSFLMKGKTRASGIEDPLAVRYRPHLIGHTLTISFMTVAEFYEGAFLDNWLPAKMLKLEQILKDYVVLPFSPTICRTWGEVRAERKTRTIPVADAWIAATAIAHGLTLVTHNPRDFSGIQALKIITEQK